MTLFICSNCGEGSATWMGRCPSCQQWETFKEARGIGEPSKMRTKETQSFTHTSFQKIKQLDNRRISTGMFEFDRVLGGGMVKGSAILLTGEPGVGKSTLLLQGLKSLSTVYISGEESAEQVKDRADRLKLNLTAFIFSDTLQVEGIIEGINEMKTKPEVIVIDSIQTVYSKDIDSPPGNISQLREATSKLIRLAKESGIPIMIVGHVTKDGDIAGPKTLEHMVDAVLHFEGERISNFRILRANKNRFGSTDEIGIFEMKEMGLVEIDNPLAFVEDDRELQVPGKSIVGIMEGRRPLFFEIQALASPTFLSMPRRVVKGVDYNKVLLLLAVIQKNLNISLSTYDLYINVVGGVDIKSTAADLGIAAAVISSIKNIPISAQTLFT
ncbi:MAG: DNA repair protein RadA, partial [Candidatus Roizmanbacteria bacterium]|nr:DNA repair protein RadA [Candidatus Roizmanbacteria bacterium]